MNPAVSGATTSARAPSTPLASAVEVLVHGFAALRGTRRPVSREQHGGLWVVRDVDRTRPRVEEWFGHGLSPSDMDRTARRHRRGHHAILCFRAPDEPVGPLRMGFRELGYRLQSTQPLLRHALARIPAVPAPVAIARVRTPALARQLAVDWLGQRWDADAFDPASPLRDHVAREGGEIVGVAQSLAVPGGSWLVDLRVRPWHRRRGIGRALLARVLRDERRRGGAPSVLLASRMGLSLYRTLGYEVVGELLVFTPRRDGGPGCETEIFGEGRPNHR